MQSTITRIDELPHGKYGLHLTCWHVVVCDENRSPRGQMAIGHEIRCQDCKRAEWRLLQPDKRYRFYVKAFRRLKSDDPEEYVTATFVRWRLCNGFIAQCRLTSGALIEFYESDVCRVEWE